MKTFKFHWRDGKVSTGRGTDAADALTRLGYGGGAVAALDYHEEVKEAAPDSSHNKGRVLTIRVTIEDPEKANWIWEGLSLDQPVTSAGVTVQAVSNGDLFDEHRKLEEAYDQLAQDKRDPWVSRNFRG